MGAGWDLLATGRVTKIAQVVQDQRELPQPLLFLNRTPVVNVAEDEMTARFKGHTFIADIVSLDSRAIVREAGTWAFDTSAILKIKHGFAIPESKVALLDRIDQNAYLPTDMFSLNSFINDAIDRLILGVRQRIESMIIAMHLGRFGYDNMDIKVEAATWGRPNDLEVALVGTAKWDQPATAKPLDDIFALKYEVAQLKYGEQYNRITMSTRAFNYMINTTQFQDRVRLQLNFAYATTGFPVADKIQQKVWAEQFLGMTIELYDGVYFAQDKVGAVSTPNRFLPENKIIFSNTSDDNNRTATDWANGIVYESIIGSFASGGLIGGGFGGPQYGPVAYGTLADTQLNPPGLSLWTAARGFPRYHRETCSAVLEVFTI